MKYLSGFLFILLFASVAYSQTDPGAYYDSGWVQERHVDTLALNEYAQDEEFQYNRTLIEGPTLMEQFIGWMLRKLFGNYSPGDVKLVNRIFLIILVLAGLGLLIFYLSKLSRSRILAANGQETQHVRFLDFEGSSSDLEKQWLAAEHAGDYALALRYLFIKTLYFLKEKNTITFKKEKTNSDYLKELKEQWQHGPFQELSRIFAYTQYGGYGIREEDYRSAKALYERLLNGGKGGLFNG